MSIDEHEDFIVLHQRRHRKRLEPLDCESPGRQVSARKLSHNERVTKEPVSFQQCRKRGIAAPEVVDPDG